MVAPAQGAQINAQGIAVRDRGGAVLSLDSDELGIQNIGGVLKQVNPDGSTSSLGGAADSSPIWVQQAHARATLLNGGSPFTNGRFVTSFDDANWAETHTSTATNTISATAATALVTASGTTNGSSSKVFAFGTPVFIPNILTAPIYVRVEWQLTNAVQSGHVIRVMLNKPDSTANTAFGVMGTTFLASGSNANYTTSVYNGTTETGTASATAIDITLPHVIEGISNGAGSINWLLDQTLVATQPLTSGNVGAVPVTLFVQTFIAQPGGQTSCGAILTRMFAEF